MKVKISLALALFMFIALSVNAQNLVWTGSASNNDFFDENNWKEASTNVVPTAGSIDSDVSINLNLQISAAITKISARGNINLGTGNLYLTNATVVALSITGAGGSITINEGGYFELTDAAPIKNSNPKVQINFTSGLSWLKTTNFKPRLVSANHLGQIKVDGNTSVYKTNLRLDNYYQNGCVIRAILATATPLKIYDDLNLQGTATGITVNTIHSGTAIANTMNNKIQSFILKKGFMVTFAVENDGTGNSKNYIASEEDLVINALPRAIRNSISFIRVMPWNWVTKKGRTGTQTDLETSWRYAWNNTESTSLDWEYAPMAWGGSAANDAADIALYVAKYNSTHVMAFNEADPCDAQSGQYGNPKLCVTDEAVRLYKNLMKTGLRLVSPSCTEGAATVWLKEFHKKATDQDIRIDVIGVHWYDWGGNSNPSSTPNANATQVFNRFKTYLTNVYNLYKLPIWITEFNANPYRSTAVQLAFMKLALPYLETLPYVERYNWFQPNPTPLDPDDNANQVGTGEFYTTRPAGAAPILTEVGIVYRDQFSEASIPKVTTDENNNLSLAEYPNVVLKNAAIASSSFSTASSPSKAVDGDSTATSQWLVNFGTAADANQSPLPAWIEVDLKGSFTIDSFRIIETSKALKDFRFEVWDSTLNSGSGGWNIALTVTGNPGTPITTYKTFTPVTTTKIRLFITGHNSTDYVRISELEVYGYAAETLGVQKYESNAFKIYPNPVDAGILNISGKNPVESVKVYTILGSEINISYEANKLKVGDLAPGIYVLKINNKYSFKFVKK